MRLRPEGDSERRLEELRQEAHYHSERLQIYRAKVYGPRPTSPARLRELERAYELAAARLRRAEEAANQPRGGDA